MANIQVYLKQSNQNSKKSYLCKMKTLNQIEKEFINQNIESDTNKLLFQPIQEDIDIKFCVQQIEGIKKAKEKFPSLLENNDLLFPPKINLEQTSSEQTAKYKASYSQKNQHLETLHQVLE